MVSLKPACSIQQVPGQPQLYSEILSKMQPKKLQLKKFEWRYPAWVDNASPKAMCTSAWYKILPYRVLVVDAQEVPQTIQFIASALGCPRT